MKVGDYVRTDNGIAKCIDIDKNNGDYVFDKSIFYELDGQRTHILYKYYLQDEIDDGMKISPSIIDLIEVGDYVNGFKVIDILENDIYISDFYAESYIGVVKAKDIKSIVTREMFESMEYKVGENQ